MPKARKKEQVNPLDAALESKQKLADVRKMEEHALWEQWKQNPTPQTLNPLMKRFEPLFRAKTIQYKAPNVNTTAFRSNLKIQAMNAFESFNPEKAALRTHVENHLKRSMRFNAQHQNNAYIPEGQAAYIGAIDRARDELLEDTGEEPSHHQIAQFINARGDLLGNKKRLTPTFVARVQGSRRKDIISSSVEGDIAPLAMNRNDAVLGLLPAALNQDQMEVFNHIYGMNGAPRIDSTSALAKKLGKSPSQISRLKSSIATEYKKYL